LGDRRKPGVLAADGGEDGARPSRNLTRIAAQAIEAQISVVAAMGIAYGLTIVMLNTNPGPIKKLLFSQFGSLAAAGVIVLQAIGTFWIWRMSRIRF